jgi:hypothetical protein
MANFRGPKKKLFEKHNFLLYNGGNMLIFYWRGCKNQFVIAINSLYQCLLYLSFAVVSYKISGTKVVLFYSPVQTLVLKKTTNVH